MSSEDNSIIWHSALRTLLLGVGLMNNLTEAGVQLRQLESELPNLLAQNQQLPPDFQGMTYEECIRQVRYSRSFYDDLGRMLQKYNLVVTEGEKNNGTKSCG